MGECVFLDLGGLEEGKLSKVNVECTVKLNPLRGKVKKKHTMKEIKCLSRIKALMWTTYVFS